MTDKQQQWRFLAGIGGGDRGPAGLSRGPTLLWRQEFCLYPES